MNTVKIRDIEIGAGAPKIIVPIVGVTKEDIGLTKVKDRLLRSSYRRVLSMSEISSQQVHAAVKYVQ